MKLYFIKFVFFSLIILLFNACMGFTTIESIINHNNSKLLDKDIITEKEIENLKDNVSNSKVAAIGYDRDSFFQLINDHDTYIKYFYGFSLERINKYVDYYYIIDKNTHQLIGWEFTNCDKRKIDPSDEKSYTKCLRDTRITKDKNNIYRIGVNKTILKKYGYKDEDKLTKSKDDMKIARDVLNAEGLCKDGIDKILKKEYWGIEYNVRYYVKCKD